MTETEPVPIDGKDEPAPAQRVVACELELAELLARHHCTIVSRIRLEPVGQSPARFFGEAFYSVEPLE